MKKELVERLQALAIIVGLIAYLIVSMFCFSDAVRDIKRPILEFSRIDKVVYL